MRRFQVDTNQANLSYIRVGEMPPMLALGAESQAGRLDITRARRHIRRRIRGETGKDSPLCWATLSMANGRSPLAWRGEIQFSREGNLHSVPIESTEATCREIELIRSTVPESGEGKHRVRERFINLDNVVFSAVKCLPDRFNPNHLPQLRLTLFLRPDQGALIYYQHEPLDSNRRTRKTRDESDIEYLQPQPTKGHDCRNRDRLIYDIPLLPSHILTDVNDDDEMVQLGQALGRQRMVLKVLTFNRYNHGDSTSIVDRISYHLFGNKHELLTWNPARRTFIPAYPDLIRKDVPTLLILHGTFSSTTQAFTHLLADAPNSWLADQYGTSRNKYPQILAFDHPTLSEDAKSNAAALQSRLPRGFIFEQPLDLITHSRGGLLGKWLSLYEDAFPVQRGALVACANGVGYFTAGSRVAKGLSVLRAINSGTAGPTRAAILAVAQHSAKWFLNQPGCRLMTPQSNRLAAVLEKPNQPFPQFLPIVGNFQRELVSHNGLIARWLQRGLDLAIKPILGRQHDWVVGTKQQYILADESYPSQPKRWLANVIDHNRVFTARHSDYFGNPKIQRRISTYLRYGKAW
ncbi:hypothetical protein ACERK3_17320 [Phycisphaerales bacterium AB-hyl4]|uniref:DUF7379 domain-containing protein n=1 Tax=Natronomicrosphaera hydrolytica TaxID=3242702 RepID=A0ABV4UAA7_9BACT